MQLAYVGFIVYSNELFSQCSQRDQIHQMYKTHTTNQSGGPEQTQHSPTRWGSPTRLNPAVRGPGLGAV